MENNSSFVDHFELYQGWSVRTGQPFPIYGSSSPFWPDLNLLNIDHDRRSNVFSEMPLETDHLSAYFHPLLLKVFYEVASKRSRIRTLKTLLAQQLRHLTLHVNLATILFKIVPLGKYTVAHCLFLTWKHRRIPLIESYPIALSILFQFHLHHHLQFHFGDHNGRSKY